MLPTALAAAAGVEIDQSRAGLRRGMADLTKTYRTGGRSSEGMDFAAYLAARLPATYAAVTRAVLAAADHVPGLAPRSVLDVGSGPGTASWAAAEVFSDLTQVTFLDSNRRFLDLSLRLAVGADHAALRAAAGVEGDMSALPLRADLVIAAYALAELPESKAGPIADHLWSKADQALILVEPGTPAGFARLRLARIALIVSGATIAAPCPHNESCPISGTDWCHFTIRLPRSRAHMQAKGATVPFEDEPFAYLVASRLAATPAPARILSPPHLAKPGVTLRLCGGAGIQTRTVAKREGEAFKRAKKAGWGDAWT